MTVCKSCPYTIQCWRVLWWQCHLRHYWDISFEPKYLLHWAHFCIFLCNSSQRTGDPKIFAQLRGKHVVWRGLAVDFRLKFNEKHDVFVLANFRFPTSSFWDLFQLSQMTGRRWWSATGPFDLQPRRSPFVARRFMDCQKGWETSQNRSEWVFWMTCALKGWGVYNCVHMSATLTGSTANYPTRLETPLGLSGIQPVRYMLGFQ